MPIVLRLTQEEIARLKRCKGAGRRRMAVYRGGKRIRITSSDIFREEQRYAREARDAEWTSGADERLRRDGAVFGPIWTGLTSLPLRRVIDH